MKKSNVYRYVKKSKDGKEQKTTWYCSFTYIDIDGKKKKKTKRGFKLEREAKKWEEDFLKEIEYNKQTSHDGVTFAEFVEIYKQDNKNTIREHTWQTKENIIKAKLVPYFGNKKLDKITNIDIRRWQNNLLEERRPDGKPYSKDYLRTIFNQLFAILSHAVRYYGLTANPAAGECIFQKNSGQEKQCWTTEEYLKFADEIMDKPDVYYAFEILYWCGLRISELLALTPDDIDFENNVIKISKGYHRIGDHDVTDVPKTKKSNRNVEMPDFLAEELKEYIDSIYGIEKGQRIFEFSEDRLRHAMIGGCKSAGVKRIRMHDLRHSHVSLLISMGFSSVEIADRLGHKSIEITHQYAHAFPNAQKKIAKRLDKERNGENVTEESGQEQSLEEQNGSLSGIPRGI